MKAPAKPSTSKPARAGLLSGIEGFSKGKLKKTVTKDCSAPVTSRKVNQGGITAGPSNSGGGGGRPTVGGGPSGFGNIFAGGMPQLRSVGAKPKPKVATLRKSNMQKPATLRAPPDLSGSQRRLQEEQQRKQELERKQQEEAKQKKIEQERKERMERERKQREQRAQKEREEQKRRDLEIQEKLKREGAETARIERERQEAQRRQIEMERKRREEEERIEKQRKEQERRQQEQYRRDKEKREQEALEKIQLQNPNNNFESENTLRGPCHKCRRDLSNSEVGMEAEGIVFHKACFACGKCGKVLGEKYFGDAHDPRCEPCAQQDLNQSETSNCSICLQPITGTYLLQNGKSIHTTCLTCVDCRKPLFQAGQKEVSLNKYSDGYVCSNCEEKRCDKCDECGRAIDGEFLNLLNRKLHKNCVLCCVCKTLLNPQKVYIKDGQPACETHATQTE
mmetsp:Transcript_1710/g.2878  ORF Transcript_1710/g.2878 Transcript_1710/m.2878 type:complete len:450 (+) Transcript_1710:1-1350(+)